MNYTYISSDGLMMASSIVKTYLNPEQPPPSTAMRRFNNSFFDLSFNCLILCIDKIYHSIDKVSSSMIIAIYQKTYLGTGFCDNK